VKEIFLSDLRKTREQLKGHPEEMAKVSEFIVIGDLPTFLWRQICLLNNSLHFLWFFWGVGGGTNGV